MPAIAIVPYTGDGASGLAVNLGITPVVAGVMRGVSGAGAQTIWRTQSMGANESLIWRDSAAGSTEYLRSLTSTGITVGNNALVNAVGDTYYAWGIAADDGYVATGTYTGDGTDNRDIAVSFQPDIVIVQDAAAAGTNATQCSIWIAARGGDNSAFWEGASASASNRIQGANAAGFQVGTGMNTNLRTFYWLGLRRKAKTILDGLYNGNGTDNRNIVLDDPFQPSMVWVKHSTGLTSGAYRMNESIHSGDQSQVFSDTAVYADIIQNYNLSGFQIGSSAAVNTNGVPYWFIAFNVGGSGLPEPGPTGTGSAAPSPFEAPDNPYAWYKMGLDMLNTYKAVKIL